MSVVETSLGALPLCCIVKFQSMKNPDSDLLSKEKTFLNTCHLKTCINLFSFCQNYHLMTRTQIYSTTSNNYIQSGG